jgi:glycosyltransferase involved in cell wall biosynthesis
VSEPSGEPLVSVIVPTRDRPDRLARCLTALERQTALESTEIVVVDDGSNDASAVRSVVAGRTRIRLVRQSAAGPAAARNSGILTARGRYVCFTDDDCEPQPDWIERMVGSLRDGAAVTAGLTLNGSPGNPFAEASELIGTALSTPAPNGRAGIAFARSNNLACRKDLLAEILFDEHFPAAAGEDREWSARLLATGNVLVSEPRAVVVHRQQLGLRDFWGQQLRYGRGAYRFRAARSSRSLERPMFYAHLVRRGFRRGGRVGLLVIVAQVATAIGFVAEWKGSRASRTVGQASRAAGKEVSSSPHGDGRQAD